MNQVASKSKACVDTNVDKCEPPDCKHIVEDINKIKSKTKTLNGIVNGNGARNNNDEESVQMTKSEESDTQRNEDETDSKPMRKGKSKKKSKCESSSDSCNPCLQDDFDITSIIRNKHRPEGCSNDDKLKIVVGQIERLELKKDEKVNADDPPRVENPQVDYVAYQSELQMPLIMKIIQKDLSEPYSIYTYRYFIHNWPNLCFLAMHNGKCVGAIVCKLDMHRKVIKRGYIAMLAVDKQYRKHGLGSTLVKRAIQEMIAGEADEVVLETEITNRPALRLYEALGFVRDKRLFRYYLNGVDALRLKLWLR